MLTVTFTIELQIPVEKKERDAFRKTLLILLKNIRVFQSCDKFIAIHFFEKECPNLSCNKNSKYYL